MRFDIERLRADFPILAERPYGKPLVYLDNAASAQKPNAVIDRLTHFYAHEYANVHRGLHYLANAATDAYEAARESVRRYPQRQEPIEEIVFTRSATEAINLVASSYGLRAISASRRRNCAERSWSTTPISCPGISCASARERY